MGEEGGAAAKPGGSEKMSLEDACFGVLFTLQKEQNGSDTIKGKLITVAKTIVEFVQLLLFVLAGNQVGQWGWHMSFNSLFWKWFNYFQAENPITNDPTGSYKLWLVFFYLLAAVLVISLGLCVFVASCFKSGSFPVVWPVKLLRALVSVVFSVLFVSSLDIFLVGVACIPDPSNPKGTCVLYNFTSVAFVSFPHIIHGVIAALMACTIIVISSLIAVADSEQNFLSKDLRASFDSAYNMRRFLCFTALTLASNFLVGYLKLLSIIIFLIFLFVAYDTFRLPPFYHAAANMLVASCVSLLTWGSLLLVIKMYTSGPVPYDILFGVSSSGDGGTDAANATASPPSLSFPPPLGGGALSIPPAALSVPPAALSAATPPPAPPAREDNSLLLTQIGFYASPGIVLLAVGLTKLVLWRSRRFFDKALGKVVEIEAAAGERIRLQPAAVAEALRDSVRFSSIAHVELAIRPLRQALWDPAATPESKAHATLAAEALALLGMRQFGGGKRSALIYILYGCFLIDFSGNHVRGYSYLDKARNMRLSMRERFMIFARDRERTHRAQGDSVGSGAMDLVSYVEFTSSFANLVKQHRSALRATRSFWRLLVSPTISFASLSAAFKQMDETEALADTTYRSVLKKYPKSVKLLRAYAAFLEEVRNNPWGARKYREDADKLEEALADEGDDRGIQQVSDSDAVVVVDATAVITVVNHAFLKLFGYKKQEEVVGKNIGILCPPPHDKLHTSYIDNYVRTGEGRILGVRQQIEARNAKGENFPIILLVSKIETNGETSFMGIISQREAETYGDDAQSEASGSVSGRSGASDSPVRVAEVKVPLGGKPVDPAVASKPASLRHGTLFGGAVDATVARGFSSKGGSVASRLVDAAALGKDASAHTSAAVGARNLAPAAAAVTHSGLSDRAGEPAAAAASAAEADAEAPGPVAEAVEGSAAARLGASAPRCERGEFPAGGPSLAPRGSGGGIAEDVVQRARSAGCVFFADAAPPHPVAAGASVGSCPFATLRAPAAVAEAAAPAPPPPPPSPFQPPASVEAAIALQQLQATWLRPARGAGGPAAFAEAAARALPARTEAEWEALLSSFRHMLPGRPDRRSDDGADDADDGAGASGRGARGAPGGGVRVFGPQAVTEGVDRVQSDDWQQLINTARGHDGGGGANSNGAGNANNNGNGDGAVISSSRMLDSQPSADAAPANLAQAAAAVAMKMRASNGGITFNRGASTIGAFAMQLQTAASLPLAQPRIPPESSMRLLPADAGVQADDDGLRDAQSANKQHAAEFQRARRFRQLQKLLNSLQMRKAVVLLYERTRYILAFLVLSYVAGFIQMNVELSHYDRATLRIEHVGQLTERTVSAACEVTAIAGLQASPPVAFATTVAEAKARLLGIADNLKFLQHGLFLGFEAEREHPDDDVYQYMITPSVNESQWVRAPSLPASGKKPFGGRPAWKLVSPWKAMRRFEMHSRIIATPFDDGVVFADSPTRVYIGFERDFQYVFDNIRGVYDALAEIQDMDVWAQRKEVDSHQITAIAIMVTLLIICTSSLGYFRRLLEEVAKARIVLFQVFLVVPVGIVAKLGAKTLRTKALEADEQGDADDDLEDAWDPQQAAAGVMSEGNAGARNSDYAVGAKKGKFSRVVGKVVNARRLSMEAFGRISTALQGKVRRWSSSIARRGAAMTGISSVKISTKDDRVLDPAGAAADSYAFLLPLLAFSVLAVAAFGVCYDLLQAAEGPLINVDASNVELVQAARVRLFAMQAVAAATLGAGNSTVRALQAELRDAATLLLAQHQLLMTGAEFPGLHGNTVGADSASRKYLMFVEQCLRFDESQCVAEEHPFWTRVHHGLYALLRYYVQTALLLSRDPVSSLTADNPLFRFIEFAGPGDVYDGLIRNREIYYQDTLDAPKAGKGLLIAALPLICAGSWLFMQRYFGPWTKRTLHESKVVAELLAQLPRELNVEQMLMEAMGVVGAKEAAVDTPAVAFGGRLNRRSSELPRDGKGGPAAPARNSNNMMETSRSRVSMRASMRGSMNSVAPMNGGSGMPRDAVAGQRAVSFFSAGQATRLSVAMSNGGSAKPGADRRLSEMKSGRMFY